MEMRIHAMKGLEKAKIFHVRGALNKKQLRFWDGKIISWLLSANKNPDEMSDMQKLLSSDEKVDFVAKESIMPIVEYIHNEQAKKTPKE